MAKLFPTANLEETTACMEEKKQIRCELEELLKKKAILTKLAFAMYVLLLQTQLEFGNQHPSVSLL